MQLIQKLRDDQKCIKKVEPSSRSKAIEDIISIGSFMEAIVLNHYVLVRKIFQMNAKDKSRLGYGSQIQDGVLSYENEVFESVFDSSFSDVEDSPVNDRFAKVEGMHAVPPPMTGNYIPPKFDFGIDESKFTYGPKQSTASEYDAKTSNFASCDSNSSVETLKSVPKPVTNDPKAVSKPKVWSDAPIIKHMTENKAYLVDYQEFNGGLVAFRGSKGQITGIKREYSNARTLQQNRVVERKNRTLIEDARTMLADSFLPNTFWAKAVSTACYLLNRILVTKPQNKTPYELLTGKFEEKSNEGFLVGYSLSSKAFRPITVENKANKIAGPKETNNSAAENLRKMFAKSTEDLLLQAGAARASSTNYVNTARTPVNAASTPLNTAITPSNKDDSQIPSLEDIYKVSKDVIFTSASSDDEGAVADFTNLETTMNPYLFACFLSQIEPKKISQALKDESWVDAMQEEMMQFKIQNVWILVDLPFGKKEIGTKWVYRNKKDERGVVVRNKARLVAHGHRQEEGTDYNEVFAPVARIEAIGIFLVFASYMGFIVYQINVKSAFLYGKIVEEVYVSQPPGFFDPKFPNKVYKVVKTVCSLHQAPKAMTSLADKAILSGADNRPPMLEKDMYDSWRTRMELPKKYSELSAKKAIQADCDVKATNIILQGHPPEVYALLEQFQVNMKFLNTLPPERSKSVTDVKLVRDLHTTNVDQLHAYLGQHEYHANEVCLMHELFQKGDDPIDAINHMMSLLTVVVTSRPSGTSGKQRVIVCYNCKGEGHMSKQCTKPKRKRDEVWFMDKIALMENLSHCGSDNLTEVHNQDNVTNNVIDQVVQAISTYEQSNIMNQSETKITSDSNIIPYSQYLNESQYTTVQNSSSLAQQDDLILSVIEQLKTQVVNYTKINQVNKNVNEILTAKLERYKDQNSRNSKETNISTSTTIVEVPKELPEVSMVNSSLKKLKFHLASFDMVVKGRTTATTITEGTWGFEHTKACFRDEIIPFVKALKELFNSFD
nr:retrovirus-related Pol polyprotein from transposon TNT 1-94 [Tanacetum cinerariifolium]